VTELELAEQDDGSFLASWNGDRIGAARIADGEAKIIMLDEPPRASCDQLLDWLEARGATTLHARALLLRHVARQRGYTGALRASLRRGEDAPGDVLAQTQALLPGCAVTVAPHGRLRGIVASLVSGLADMTRLRADPGDGRPVVTAAVPERADVNAEAIAMALDVTLSVHARFGAASRHVDTISFDHSSHGMATGTTGGEAARQLGQIHVNADYVLAQGRELDPARPRGGVTSVPEPWSTVDAITAHELWHKIEMAWDTERFAETIEFRRAVGGIFGKETLEKVFTDGDARAILARAVSAYATTNRLEASAEMFKQWWCGPPPKGSVPEQFGAIVSRFFP
jgi:hypothetical protein